MEDYSDFKEWMILENKKSVREFDKPLISDALGAFFTNQNELYDLTSINQALVDEITLEYILSYCDYGEGQGTFEIIGPMMSTHRYSTASSYISKSTNVQLKSLWNVLLSGRSILNDKPFITLDESQRMGFWTSGERAILLPMLQALNKLSPGLDGVEFAIMALLEIQNNQFELIIDIES